MRSFAQFVLVALGLWLIPGRVQGTEYFVATNGNDSADGLSLTSAWQSVGFAMNRVQGGDTIRVRGGTYRGKITFTNASGSAGAMISVFAYSNEVPVLKGSQVVEGWQPQGGGVWYVDNWALNSQQVFADGQALIQLGWPNEFVTTRACSCADWYYIPSGYSCSQINPWTKVLDIGNSLTNMSAGSFYHDAVADRLYVRLVGDADPYGHKVEASTELGILYNESSGGYLHLRGLHFRHTSTFSYTFAGWPGVQLGLNSIIEHCDIQWCDASGLTLRSNSKALNCIISNNGMLGVACNTFTNMLVSGCTVTGNNYREFNNTYAGGIRFIPYAGATVESNEVAYNKCTAIWFDTCNAGHPLVVRDNYVHHNWIAPRRAGDTVPAGSVGIYIEFSANAHVHNNLVISNANMGIHLSASRDTRVENNLVMGTAGIPGGHRGLSALIMDNPQPGYNVTSNRIVNNLIVNNLTDYDIIGTASNGVNVFANTMENNLYYRAQGAGTTFPTSPFSAAYLGKGIFNTIQGWRDATGWDRSSLTNHPQLATNFTLMASSPAIDRGTTAWHEPRDYAGSPRPVDGNADSAAVMDIGPFEYASSGAVHYVDAASTNPVAPYISLATAATNLHDAVAVAGAGALVLVRAGVYWVEQPVQIPTRLVLRSLDGAASTVIDGQDSNACLVASATGVLIDGFTFRQGNAGGDGGALWLGPQSVLANCVIRDSAAVGKGGGAFVSAGSDLFRVDVSGCTAGEGGGLFVGADSTVRLSRIAFNAASTGGGLVAGARVRMEDMTVDSNQATGDGGGLFAGPQARIVNIQAFGNSSSNGNGGGAFLDVAAVVEKSVFTSNDAVRGGGIYASMSNRVSETLVNRGLARESGGGLFAQSVRVERCRVFDNDAVSRGGGLAISGVGSMFNSLIVGNGCGAEGGGLYLEMPAVAEFCTLVDNEALTGGGVYVAGSSTGVFNSIAWSNRAVVAPDVFVPADAEVVRVLSDALLPGPGNVAGDPLFQSPSARDYGLRYGSPAIDAGLAVAIITNDLLDKTRIADGNADNVNRPDLGALERTAIRYVSTTSPSPGRPFTTWATASRNMQDAINEAATGDLVLVATGTYAVAGTISLTKGITVRSAAGPAVTTVDGGNATRVLYIGHASAIFEGFTLQRGRADAGAGAYVAAGKLSRCILRNNTATNDLGGTFTYGAKPGPYYCLQSYDSVVHEGGGGVALLRGGVMENCLVYSNSAVYGGGALSLDGGPVDFSTFSRNSAPTGGGWFAKNGTRMRSSILHGNFTGGDYAVAGTNPVWESVTAVPLPPGVGASDADPLFVSYAGADFRLQAGSPAVDSAGIGGMPGQDLLGAARPLDGNQDATAVPDRGAYEFVHADVDTDGDGLSDTNELALGTSPVNPDTDGDQMGDGEEQVAGTDPLNVGDFFWMHRAGESSGLFELNWSSRSGRTYAIYSTTNLYLPFQFRTNIPASPPAGVFTEYDPAAEAFYLIDVQVNP